MDYDLNNYNFNINFNKLLYNLKSSDRIFINSCKGRLYITITNLNSRICLKRLDNKTLEPYLYISRILPEPDTSYSQKWMDNAIRVIYYLIDQDTRINEELIKYGVYLGLKKEFLKNPKHKDVMYDSETELFWSNYDAIDWVKIQECIKSDTYHSYFEFRTINNKRILFNKISSEKPILNCEIKIPYKIYELETKVLQTIKELNEHQNIALNELYKLIKMQVLVDVSILEIEDINIGLIKLYECKIAELSIE